MDITDIVSSDFETVDGDTRVSKVDGIFQETGTKTVVVTDDDEEYVGVITQRQLRAGHVDPKAKARGLVWHVAKVDLTDDVRTVARHMVGSSSKTLPVFEGEELVGVVSADALLEKVTEYLGVLTADDVYTDELVAVGPDASLGEVLNTLREHGITHLPVLEDDTAVGIVSVYDVLDFTTREMQRSQGGSPSGFDRHGGDGSHTGFRTHGGFGERAGDVERLLDLPVSDVMAEPVRTVTPGTGLDEATAAMLDAGISSLVVTEDDSPIGIVTKTDVLRSLTWTDEPRMQVQIINIDLLDDTTRDDVRRMIEELGRKFGDLSILEANVHLHEHDEKLRGTPLLLARIRLFTDRGHFVGTGEGYGASHALSLARNVLERQLLEGKEYGRTKKHPDEEYWSKFYGWWLSGARIR